jgi:hypothetical protein
LSGFFVFSEPLSELPALHPPRIFF